ncbi:hypothetical protein H8E07_02845 [bacterium]|nr:hypothetical protein [bacterium]
MKRLLWIALITICAALLLVRLSDRAGESADPGDGSPSYAVHETAGELTATGMRPPKIRVPKDHEVHLLISAAPDSPEGLLTVAGYDDRVDAVDIGPGLAREIVFVSDRPGDDFAFRLGGEFVGRLEVTGSHLEKGHQ